MLQELKTIYYRYKVKSYLKLIEKMRVSREGLKEKQAKFTKRYEHYKKLYDEKTKEI